MRVVDIIIITIIMEVITIAAPEATMVGTIVEDGVATLAVIMVAVAILAEVEGTTKFAYPFLEKCILQAFIGVTARATCSRITILPQLLSDHPMLQRQHQYRVLTDTRIEPLPFDTHSQEILAYHTPTG